MLLNNYISILCENIIVNTQIIMKLIYHEYNYQCDYYNQLYYN